MNNKKTYRRLMGFSSQMAVLALLAGTAVAQTSTTTRTVGASTSTTRQERGRVVQVEGNTVLLRMSTGAYRTVTVPDSRTAVVDGKTITVHDLKPGTTLTATYTTTTTPVTDRTVSNLSGKVWFVSGNTVILTLPDGTNKMYKSLPHFTFKIDGNDKADVSNLRKGMNVSAEKIVEEPSVIVANNTEITGSAPPPVVAQVRAPTAVSGSDRCSGPADSDRPHSGRTGRSRSGSWGSYTRQTSQNRQHTSLAGLLGLLFMGAGFGLRLVRRA